MSTTWRIVRVFLSSTFDDMHAEREHLIKVVFPNLRDQLRPHRVELIDVDLRWGVGRDQAENERVLTLSLDQIDESRPFFIALVGSRYGWPMSQFSDELRRKFPWIKPQPPRSLTDLEISHGALNDSAWMSRALFCIRDAAVLETIPEPFRHQSYVETKTSAIRKLAELKQRIEACGYPIERYSCRWSSDAPLRPTRSHGRLVDLDDFGQRVQSWLWFAIRAELKLLAPASEEPLEWMAEEADMHERYRETCRASHVPRAALNRELLAYASSDSDQLCLLTGPAGSGKSAALAHFIRTFRLQHPKALVVGHFIGATPRSTSLRELLGRLCEEMKARLKLALPIPAGTAERLSVFLGLLMGVPSRVRLVLVFDGLERLDPDHDAHTLHWLPERLRAHVKIVAACRDDGSPHPVLSAFGQRNCLRTPMEPLSDEERLQIAQTLPRMPARALGPDRLEELLANPATRNPLFLTVALEELRAGSSGLTVEEWLARLPTPARPGSTEPPALARLFEGLLHRLEEEFDHELVPTTLALLVSARRGLSEQELRDLTADCQLHSELFPLLRWLRPYLWNRGGQLEILSPQFREVIERCYLKKSWGKQTLAGKGSDEELGIRTRLAHYFGSRPVDVRQLEELPWQLAEMRGWESLVSLLSDLPFLSALWGFSEIDVKGYWTRTRSASNLRQPDAYRAVLDDPAGHDEYVAMIATLLQSAQHLGEALVLREYQGESFRKAGNTARLAHSLGSQAALHIARDDYPGAMRVLKQQEEICRQNNDLTGLKGCLGNQAVVLRKRGEYQAALALHKEEEQLCRQMNSSHGVALSLINQAHLLADKMKQPAAALPLAEEAYRLATRHGFNNLAGQIKTRLARIKQKVSDPEQTAPDSQADPSSRLLNWPDSGIG
jgi:Domain of unknown function (DUF4062)/NACHT domain